MRILVTGSAGRLGRHVRTRLEARGDIDPVYLVSPRHPFPEAGDVVADLADAASLRDAVVAAAPDAIVHLGGIVGAECDRDPAVTHVVNVVAVAELAAAAAAGGASRFVLASTAAVYGDRPTEPLTEDAALDLASAYAASKAAAEDTLCGLGVEHPGLQSVALRIFNIYGAGFSASLVERLAASTADAPVELRGFDEFVRDYVRADDVVTAILASVEVDHGSTFSVYNIGSGVATSNRQLVETLGAGRKVHYRVTAGTQSYSVADISRARGALGFSPAPLG